MMEQNAPFRSLSNNYYPKPLKPKVYLFAETSQSFNKRASNPEKQIQSQIIAFQQSAPQISIKKSWKPKIQNKKLFEDPKFFISLQKKKIRIINGLKNSSCLTGNQYQRGNQFRGGKVKSSSSFSVHRTKKSSEQEFQMYILEGNSSQKPREKQSRTPYLNFNMQYLIKKRKSFGGLNKMENFSNFSSQLQCSTGNQKRANSHSMKVKTIDCSYLGTGRH